MAILQFHLENWPGFGMAKHPANKAVYINPARESNIYFAKHFMFADFSCRIFAYSIYNFRSYCSKMVVNNSIRI